MTRSRKSSLPETTSTPTVAAATAPGVPGLLGPGKPTWPPTPAHLRIYVGDVAAAVERAIAAGARTVTHPTMLAFGERVARVRDPQGHLWWLHEHVEDVAPGELASRSPNRPPRRPWPTSSAPCGKNWRATSLRLATVYQAIREGKL